MLTLRTSRFPFDILEQPRDSRRGLADLDLVAGDDLDTPLSELAVEGHCQVSLGRAVHEATPVPVKVLKSFYELGACKCTVLPKEKLWPLMHSVMVAL